MPLRISTSSPAHIVVVGAGIVGAAVAEALTLDGHRVTVVDKGPPGAGATAAGMGHVVVMDDSPAQIALTSYSQRLWDERALALPTAGERLLCGTLWVAADDAEMAEVARKADFYHGRSLAAKILDAAELYVEEPHLRPGLAGGLLVPGDSVVYPPPIAAAMIGEVVRCGGMFRRGIGVASVKGHEVKLTDGTVIGCDYAINAAGSEAGILSPEFDIRPRKGHLVITDRYPGYIKHQLVELGYLKSAHKSTASSVAFNVQPRPTGQLLIGSSRQYGDDRPDVDYEILGQMLARAVDYMPGLADLSAVRIWTGFRAATPDKLPLIGPHPDDPHLILATGHEGLGITTSSGTAALVADHLAGRTPSIPIEPYLPSRLLTGAAYAR